MANLDLPILWIYIIQEIIYSIIGCVVLFSIYTQYKKKKNHLTTVVVITIISLELSLVFSILQHLSYAFSVNLGVFQFLPYFGLMIASYFWFDFSRIVFLGEHEHTMLEKIVLSMTIIAIIFGFLRYFTPLWFGETSSINRVIYFTRFGWLLTFEGLINGIILIGTFQLKGRIPKSDPFRSKITNIILIAIVFLIMTVLYLSDTMYTMITNVYGTWMFLGGNTAVLVFIIYTHRTFFTTPNRK